MPRKSIILGKLLGAGNFDRVYKATTLNFFPGEDRTTVAVKMIHSRISPVEVKAMRNEIEIMSHIEQHVNIVTLLGACSMNLASKGGLLLLLEYCHHENIFDYMHRCRFELISQITDDDQFDLELSEPPPPTLPSDSSSRYKPHHIRRPPVECSLQRVSLQRCPRVGVPDSQGHRIPFIQEEQRMTRAEREKDLINSSP